MKEKEDDDLIKINLIKSLDKTKYYSKMVYYVSLMLTGLAGGLIIYVDDRQDIAEFLITFTDKAIYIISTIFGFVIAGFTIALGLIDDDYVMSQHIAFDEAIKRGKFDTIQKNIFGFYWTIITMLCYLLFIFTLNIILLKANDVFIGMSLLAQQLIYYGNILLLCMSLAQLLNTIYGLVVYAQVRYIIKQFNIYKSNTNTNFDKKTHQI